ncbi:NPCBM/NEW2 domain-containing protein [Actinopolymorpha sp. B17G11]|uniref:NPCBM/NEW2 domain-containing protein n=1 Tax=Actinopolymorpha sp. B17G11 TaxID=3160861 RepID=UPI0032E49B01
MNEISRRVFLGAAGTTLGAAVVGVAGRAQARAAEAAASDDPSIRGLITDGPTGWTLENDVVRLVVSTSGGGIRVTSVSNKDAGREYQTAVGGRQLFAYEFDGAHEIVSDDGNWQVGEAELSDLVMHTPQGTSAVGRRIAIPLRRAEPQPVTVTVVFEVYKGRAGLRFSTLIKNDDSTRKTTITTSTVFALALADQAHTLYHVPNASWKSTRGSLAPLPADTSSHGKRAELPKKVINVYDSGDGWSVSPELNWKTMRGNGKHAEYMLPPFASINAWHDIDHVRVTTNPESLQLVLFPGEEFEYLSVNVTVFSGDVVDAKMADQEHFRKRFRYNNVTTLFNTNDWDYRGGPGRDLPEDYYFTTVIPKAEQAGFDMVMLDDLWNTSRDTLEPNPAMASSIRSLQEFADSLEDKDLLFGLWFSLTGAGHASGRDLANPDELAYKKEQIETLINQYHVDHHMMDLTQYWQNEQETAYSHPSDNVYRKAVLTRAMVNSLVESYPHYLPKMTTELDIYPTQGDRNNGLLHVTYNGWNTANGGVTGENLSLRTAITHFGHLPMEAMYMNLGRLTGRMEDYYSYMAVRNVKFGQDPGNEQQWPESAIELMAVFNRWRRSARVRALTEELFRPVYLGRGWDGPEWDSSSGPYVWMYTDEEQTTALLIATAVGTAATRVVADLRWLDAGGRYVVSDISLDDDGTHTYAYRGTFTGVELREPGLPLDLLATSSRGQALWIQRVTGPGLQLAYVDENATDYAVQATDWDIRVAVSGQPGKTVTVITADPAGDRGLVRTVDLNPKGRGVAVVAAAQMAPPTRVVFTTLSVELDRTSVVPGDQLAVTATFVVDDFGPLTDVDINLIAPGRWTLRGEPAHAQTMATGDELRGEWTLSVPAETTTYGFVEIPVIAKYKAGKGPDAAREAEELARVLVAPEGVAYVSDLPFVSERNGWGPVERDMSNGGTQSGDGTPLRLRGTTYDKGLGVHAPSEVVLDLAGAYTRFTAYVGVDDSRVPSGAGSVVFEVLGDGVVLARTGVLTPSDAAYPLDVAVDGVASLMLRVSDGGDGINNDHADWADAQLHRVV